MDKKYISAAQAAQNWGISLRSVQNFCKNGKIAGAKRFGNSWSIPDDASRPEDGRRKSSDGDIPHWHQPLIRKTPFLLMTDLYTQSGRLDESVEAVSYHPEAHALLTAQAAYARGNIDKAYEYCRLFLENRSGLYAVLSGAMTVALCALWKGDIDMYRKARRHIYEAPCTKDIDRDIVVLSTAVVDLSIRNTRDFPEWFQRGCLDTLPIDAFPAARVQYLKYLTVGTQLLATMNMEYAGLKAMDLMRTHPFIIELMISQAVVEKSIMEEIYLRLMGAICYNSIGERALAVQHIDKAIALCMADGLYGILAEFCRTLGTLLDERLENASSEVAATVKKLYKTYNAGWTKVHNIIMERRVFEKLTPREREVARLAAFGLTNQQIAEMLFLSEASVKSIVKNAKDKTGANTRAELGSYI